MYLTFSQVSGCQTANYAMRTEDLPHTVPERTIVHCLKTMARRTSSVRTVQSYQSGQVGMAYQLSDCAHNVTRTDKLSGLSLVCFHGPMPRETF